MKFPEVDGLRGLELGTPGPMREWLNGLVLEGEKRATAGTMDDYEDNEFEHVGERLALLGDQLDKIAVVEVTGTSLTTLGEVPWTFAAAEGEGDLTIEEWRAGHRRFWKSIGLAATDEMPVWLIYFRLVSTESP